MSQTLSAAPPLPTRAPLTPEVIADLKAQMAAAGLDPVLYKFALDKDQVVFRPLLKIDWDEINAWVQSAQGNVRQDAIDQKICEKALMWPADLMNPLVWEFQRAGMQSSMAKQVLARSGFFDPELDQTDYLQVEPLGTPPEGVKPTPEVIATLKEQHAALRLVTIDQQRYIMRPINRAEWKQITAAEDLDIDLTTAQRACVWSPAYPAPPEFAHSLAGTVRALSEVVMQASGFASVPTVEEL